MAVKTTFFESFPLRGRLISLSSSFMGISRLSDPKERLRPNTTTNKRRKRRHLRNPTLLIGSPPRPAYQPPSNKGTNTMLKNITLLAIAAIFLVGTLQANCGSCGGCKDKGKGKGNSTETTK
jgi:hypothetical protein